MILDAVCGPYLGPWNLRFPPTGFSGNQLLVIQKSNEHIIWQYIVLHCFKVMSYDIIIYHYMNK